MDEYPPIECETTDLVGCSYFKLCGALEHGYMEDLAKRLTRTMPGRFARFFIVDLKEVPYMEGDGGLIELETLARERGGAVLLAGPTEPVREVFELIHLEKVLRCFNTVSDAMDFAREWIAKRRPPDRNE